MADEDLLRGFTAARPSTVDKTRMVQQAAWASEQGVGHGDPLDVFMSMPRSSE